MTDTPPNAVSNSASPDRKSLEVFLGAPPPRPWYRRPVFLIGVVVVLLLLLLLSRCFMGSGQAGYATEPVRRDNLRVTVSATGNLQPTNEVQVGSEQSGLITQVFVDNNDRVTAGQPLARLDTSRLQDALIQAQATMASAEAQVATAEASAAQAQATLARQEEVYRISNHRVPSETELDTARADLRRGVAGVRAAQAQVRQARASVSSAQTNLSKATIYSPVNGVVLSRQIDPGQTVAASFQAPVLFTIAEDLSRMKLEVRVDEADVAQVHEGQRATFTVDAYPGRTFPATVMRVDVGANASGTTTSGSSASNAASAGGSVIAYTAVLSVDNPNLELRPGMTATANIVTSERQNVLLVPNAALRWSPERDAANGKAGGVTSVLVPRIGRRGGGGGREVAIGRGSRQTVYVLGPDGNPQAVQVVVGESNGSETEIAAGDLHEGQEVITARLAPGQTQDRSQSQRRSRGGGSGSGTGGNRDQGNGAAPAAVPPGPAPQPRPGQPPAPGPTPPTAGAAPDPRTMTPEQRRAYFQSLTPEQRAQLRARRQQGGGGGGPPPDGQ